MKNKKLIWIAVALALVIGTVAGVLAFKPGQNKKPVYVYRLGDGMIAMTDYYENAFENYGEVSSDHVQSVYLSETQTILSIPVQEGQRVKKGDVLFVYDTTLSELQLQRKELDIQQLKVDLKTAQNELKKIKGYKPIYYHPTKPTNPPKPTVDKDELDLDVKGKDFVVHSDGSGISRRDPVFCWLRSSAKVTPELIEALFDAAQGNHDHIYVVFQHTRGDSGTAKVSEKYGVEFMRKEVTVPDPVDPTEPPVVPSETTEPTTAPTEQPTETVPPETEEPSETSEPTDSTDMTEAPTDPETNPSETEISGSGSNARSNTGSFRENEKTVYQYSMKFFQPEKTEVNPSRPPKEEVDWNSGFTASEIATMRKEKEEQIRNLSFEIKMAEAEYKIMKKEADSGRVCAEIDGIVSEINEINEVSQDSAEKQLLMKVTDGGGYVVTGTISELYLDTISVGQEVQIMNWDTGMPCVGTVSEIGQYPADSEDSFMGMADGSNATYYPFYVSVDGSADMKDGSYVNMTLQTDSEEQSGLYLSTAFVRSEDGSSYVYVENSEGVLEKRTIQTGRGLWDTYIQVLDGLTEEDRVAFPYGREVTEGAPTQEGDWQSLNGL